MGEREDEFQRERDRLFTIRLRSKRGGHISEEELAFCQRMLKLDGDEYGAVGREVQEKVMGDYSL